MRNGFVESFNGRLRDELRNETQFRSLTQARFALERNMAVEKLVDVGQRLQSAQPGRTAGSAAPTTSSQQRARRGPGEGSPFVELFE
jgi:hypothetical protein